VLSVDFREGEDIEILLSQRERLGSPDVVLLARATVAPPSGPWHVVLTRPFTIDDIVQAVQHRLPLTASLRHPVDQLTDD
jgi:hypothetical protein